MEICDNLRLLNVFVCEHLLQLTTIVSISRAKVRVICIFPKDAFVAYVLNCNLWFSGSAKLLFGGKTFYLHKQESSSDFNELKYILHISVHLTAGIVQMDKKCDSSYILVVSSTVYQSCICFYLEQIPIKTLVSVCYSKNKVGCRPFL